MKQPDLTTLPIKELLKEKKKAKTNYIGFVVAYALLVGISIFVSFRKEADNLPVFILLPVVFLPLMLNVSKKYKAILKEVEIRNSTSEKQ